MPKYDNYDYNTMGFGNDPLHQNENGTPNGVAGFVDDAVGGLLFGDPEASSKIWGELTGYNKQQREFAQQEYMQDKQWQHDSAVAQMARAKAAGINLNTAAAGIAGGNVSATAPAVSSSGNPASAVDAMSGLANAITGGAANLSKAGLDTANAKEVAPSAEVQRFLWSSQASHELEKIGVTKETARSLTITNKWLDSEKAQDLLIKMQQYENFRSEWQLLEDEHQLNVKALNWYDEEKSSAIALMDKQALNQAKQAEKAKVEAEYQEKVNAFFEKYGFNPSDPDDVALRNLFLKDPTLYYQTLSVLTDKAYQFSYDSARGAYGAEASFAYQIGYARRNGENASDVLFGRVGGLYDYMGRVANILGGAMDNITGSIDSAINAVPNAIKGKKIREELTMILNNAYEQLDKFPEDAERINAIITETQSALQLSNGELLQWYEKSKK